MREPEKIDFDSIKWKTPGKLYRGTFQSGLEFRALRNIAIGEGASYYSEPENDERPCRTDFGESFSDAVLIFEHRDPNYPRGFSNTKGQPPRWPFTRYPLIMEVDAEKYADNIWREEGDGITIRGPISLNDITILFSSHINRIHQLHIEEPSLLNWLGDFIIHHQLSNAENFLTYFTRQPRKVATLLYYYAFGLQRVFEKEKVEKLEEAIATIAEKLEFPEYEDRLARLKPRRPSQR